MKENYVELNCVNRYNSDISVCDNIATQKPGPNYVSQNQKLSGTPNPKTLISPIIAPRSHDFNTQRATNNTQHSHINSKYQFDNYRSGYKTSPCNYQKTEEYINTPNIEKYTSKPDIREYISRKPDTDISQTKCGFNPYSQCGKPYPHIKGESLCETEGHVINNYECNMKNNNMPVNQPSGACQQDPVFNKYNKNLNTQSIQPGVYNHNEVIEPINSNIGISFQQQFNPTTTEHTDSGETFYTEHASSIIEPTLPIDSTDVAYVYDPRHTGYGDSTRAYTDTMLGQTRFFYDDVEAMKLPNYIVRSKIDHIPQADKYGPMIDTNRNGNINTPDIREIAQNQYLDNQLAFRNDLTQRLMKKSNAKRVQQKLMPIRMH